MAYNLFYNNLAISGPLIGRTLWSIKRTDHGKDAFVALFVFLFLQQAIFREIAARMVSLQSIEHYCYYCCRFVK